MKVKYLISDLSVPQISYGKCFGPETWLPALIASAAGIGGSLLSSSSQSDVNRSNQGFAREENEKNRQFSHEENLSARESQQDFTREMYNRQFGDWFKMQDYAYQQQFQQWMAQQDYSQDIWRQQQDYFSPAAQSQRLKQAGFNPAIALGQQSATGGLSSAPSSGAPSTPVPSPSVPSSTVSSPGGTLGATALNPMSSFIDALTSLSKAAESSTHSREMWKLVEPRIKNLMANTEMQQMYTTGAMLDNEFKRKNMPTALAKSWADYKKACTDAILNMSLKGFYDESALTKSKEALLFESQKHLNDETAAKVVLEAQQYVRIVDEQIRTMKSEQARNYGQGAAARSQVDLNKSQASYFDALTQTENDMRSGKIKGQELSNNLLSLQGIFESSRVRIQSATEQDQIKALIETSKREGLFNKELEAKIDALVRNNNWIEVNQMMGCLGQAVSMYSGVKGLAINQWTAEQRADIQRQFNRIYEESVRKSPDQSVKPKLYQHNPNAGFGAPWQE